MRISKIGFLALAVVLPAQAMAQTYPQDTLIAGEVRLFVGQTQFGGSCYVNRGFSTFQRNAAGSKAVISFAEIVDSAVWDLSGQAILTFSTDTSGYVRFKQVPTLPTAVSNPPFANYTQSYDASYQRLVVSFSISFPDCSLSVFAVYDLT